MNIFYLMILLLNFVSFFLFGWDKLQAKRSRQRISERNLLGISLLGGSAGGLAGMVLFRHKVRKYQFLWKFAVIVLLQLAILYWMKSV